MIGLSAVSRVGGYHPREGMTPVGTGPSGAEGMEG